MAKYLTTDTLIDSVKRRAMIPETQQTFTETDFLAFANEEMDLGCIPHVLSFHEEYFTRTDLVDLNRNTSRYQIPSRAVGGKLRELSYQDVSGNIFEMSRIKVDDIPSYQNNAIQNSFTLFYVEGNEICLIPIVGANPVGKLRFTYYLRPNELVSQNQVSIITNINTLTGVITVDNVPKAFTSASTFDIIQTKNPHRTLAMDVTMTSATTNTITFVSTDLPIELSVGDHIALSEQTIVPQIPSELHSMLSQRVATRCLEALGDAQGLASANLKLTEMEKKTADIIENRVEGAPLKIVNKHSSLKRKKLYWRS